MLRRPRAIRLLPFTSCGGQNRSFSTVVSQWNYERWHNPKVRRLVNSIRKHYFPKELDGNRRKIKKEDPGLPLNEALKLIRDKCKNEPTLVNSEIIFQAKCRLAGENSSRSSANGIRGVLRFAKTLDKNASILVFCPESQWENAKTAGAKYVGSSELVQEILKDNLQFDRCIATVDQMPIIAKLARILGPKGLMPNMKTGTLTTDVIGAIKATLLNTPFKVDKETAQFQMAIAKSTFSEVDTRANLKVVMDYLQSQNKTTEDGKFVESAQLMLSNNNFAVPIAKNEYGQSAGPKFLVALEKLRAQIAIRQKAKLQ